MLINPDFCDLVQAIGRASLGATEKKIWHLTKIYWYTVEFGVVREGRDIKAFGAGILSRRVAPLTFICARTWVAAHRQAVPCSYGELEWMGSGQAAISPLDPWAKLPRMSYKDGFQQAYFSLESFYRGAALLKRYTRSDTL